MREDPHVIYDIRQEREIEREREREIKKERRRQVSLVPRVFFLP